MAAQTIIRALKGIGEGIKAPERDLPPDHRGIQCAAIYDSHNSGGALYLVTAGEME